MIWTDSLKLITSHQRLSSQCVPVKLGTSRAGTDPGSRTKKKKKNFGEGVRSAGEEMGIISSSNCSLSIAHFSSGSHSPYLSSLLVTGFHGDDGIDASAGLTAAPAPHPPPPPPAAPPPPPPSTRGDRRCLAHENLEQYYQLLPAVWSGVLDGTWNISSAPSWKITKRENTHELNTRRVCVCVCLRRSDVRTRRRGDLLDISAEGGRSAGAYRTFGGSTAAVNPTLRRGVTREEGRRSDDKAGRAPPTPHPQRRELMPSLRVDRHDAIVTWWSAKVSPSSGTFLFGGGRESLKVLGKCPKSTSRHTWAGCLNPYLLSFEKKNCCMFLWIKAPAKDYIVNT